MYKQRKRENNNFKQQAITASCLREERGFSFEVSYRRGVDCSRCQCPIYLSSPS